MSDLPAPTPQPEDPLQEHERQTAVRQVQQAMADGHLEFEQLDDRFELIFQATNRAELTAATAGLPTPPTPGPPPIGHPLPGSETSVFGDIKVGGWVAIDGDVNYRTVFGDLVIDLSSAQLPDQVTITAFTVFGDMTVILPDGVRASMESSSVFGSRRTDLAPPRHGAPTVRVKATTTFGDVKLYSLSRVPKGRFRKLWKTLRVDT